MLLQTMSYIDLHCDALTQKGELQVTRQALIEGGCLLQCFAAFVECRTGRYERALALCDRFDALCRENGYNVVRRASDLREGVINAMLTVEEGGAIEGDLNKLNALYERGVRMLTLTWNHPNEIGYPNFPDYEGLFAEGANFALRETRGLTPFGRETVARMGELGMLVDVSHASDGVFWDVAHMSMKSHVPFCASHSGAASVLDCARNLKDGQIRALADCGGVMGLYFCADFLADDGSAEAQRFALLANARAAIDAGGEDVLALGSDFDGIPPNAYLANPSFLPRLFDDFEACFGSRVANKIFRENALAFLKTCLS